MREKIIKTILLIGLVLVTFVAPAYGLMVTGVVLDQKGKAIVNAEVSLLNQSTTTDVHGQFVFADLTPSNGLLKVTRDGYHGELIPVYLLRLEEVDKTEISPVLLQTKAANEVRFLFGGDTSFGRRYIDPNEVTPRSEMPKDDPEALILVSEPLPGSQYVGQFIRPYYQQADWGVLNLETPLTRDPSTPHEEKAFAYFSLPESASALHWLGINSVSLGNNHLYDYLDIGVRDTIDALNSINMPHSGAGMNSDEAFLPYRTIINNTPFSFLSMTSVSGSQHPINYVAESNKAGAADLRDKERVNNAIKSELNDSYIPIVQLHGGKEYTYKPAANFYAKIDHAVKSGAKLVVGHHPHVAQGVGIIDGIVTIHSLGNLIFDQARLETMFGLLARVDMVGETVNSVRLLPVYLENFVPKPVSGRLADIFLRRIGEYSNAYGALVYPYNNQGWVAFDAAQARFTDRTAALDVDIPASGMAVVDLRMLAESTESLVNVYANNPELTLRPGRDLLYFGDFEDWDVDDDILETLRWDISGASREICSQTFRGSGALCSTRTSTNKTDSVTAFRNRTRLWVKAPDSRTRS